ncbi:sulfite exporter TauE/SafE family protein [Halioxenophilus sp. WMMB6]|uniref:sulfite exporter TauE/SafE family protein n=1 Tax=Halioxenophilus sp. WMMB6 TaxID=3073815 RepID=UPI00295E3FF5|nr:sulfite exporter TauE/SafE family protein [Halioxenophilus sp. WMMB6]
MEILLFILAGAAVGLAVGITGVGGGSLMTPILLLFGFPFNVAIGTDLLYASVTKASGAWAHRRQGTVRWRLVGLLAAGSIPASLMTATLLDSVFADAKQYEPLLTTSLGIMLILTSAVLLFKSRLSKPTEDDQKNLRWVHRNSSLITVIAGFLLGVFVTLSSVGAGAFCAALLLVLYPKLPAVQVVGTDISHAVPLTLIAGLGHLILLGNVDFILLGSLLIGSLPAIHVGTKIGARLPNKVLQPVLATILMGLGVKFAFF